MSKLTLVALCFCGFAVPSAAVLAMNYDKIFVEDRKAGTLLYFQGG